MAYFCSISLYWNMAFQLSKNTCFYLNLFIYRKYLCLIFRVPFNTSCVSFPSVSILDTQSSLFSALTMDSLLSCYIWCYCCDEEIFWWIFPISYRTVVDHGWKTVRAVKNDPSQSELHACLKLYKWPVETSPAYNVESRCTSRIHFTMNFMLWMISVRLFLLKNKYMWDIV